GDSGGGVIARKGTGPYKVVGVHSFAMDCTPDADDRKYMSTLISKHSGQICKLTGICPKK
uniref:Peptidase S1 domain-containing protein n=2 Tax=Bursaphelenchus xylophilus TaxID=6326 RepID=A0A1I7SHN4_BURXY